MKKRVGLFIRGFHHGGIEKVFESYYSHMDLSPYEIHVITHRENNPERKAVFQNLGCIIHELSPVHGSKPKKKNFEEYHALFQSVPFDVVHNNMPENLLPLLFAKRHHVAVRVLHAHSDYRANLESKSFITRKAYAAGYALNASWATHLVAVSAQAALSAFGKKKARTAFLLPNAFEVRRFAFDEKKREEIRATLGIQEKVCLGHVGRYENDIKNQEFVLQVFRDYRTTNKNAHLLMIGDGPLRHHYEELARTYGVAAHTTFTKAVQNVPDYLQAMDVFMLPSRKEGFGIAALEAQACGLPCLVSKHVPPEVDVTSLVQFLSIDEGTEQWVDALCARTPCDRAPFNRRVYEAGYDITQNAALLSNLYSKGAFIV